MAILPILDKPEAKLILKQLSQGAHTTSELNEIIVNQRRECSTATLYRRLKELHIANVISLEDGKYTLAELGESLLEVIAKQERVLSQEHRSIGHKQKNYLRSIASKPYSHREYQQTFRKSPTEISDQFKQLSEMGLIEKVDEDKDRKKRGRPKKKYKLTKIGKEVLDNLTKVDEVLEGEDDKNEED
ncbi:MAG: hypothetical protein ACXAE3_06180 [Candidatus Kariarchaeaceae archaeon]|jgi:DNA-binding HxlR family transcriptional regulator